MAHKIFHNIYIFLVIFIAISIAADIYYHNRVALADGQICYSDFRVFWFAAYNLRHHIIKFWDRLKGRPTFRPFWFLDPRLRKEPIHRAKPHQYIVYEKEEEFYRFRYSPFVAFAMIPIAKINPPGNALIVWNAIINIAFLGALLLMTHQLKIDFHFSGGYEYVVLWGVFIAVLRFYLMDISLGQTDVLASLFLALFLMAYLRGKEISCGLPLALILQFKPFFLSVVIYFIFTKKIRIVLSTIMWGLFFIFIPAYVLGLEKTIGLLRDWVEIMGTSVPSQILNVKNNSLSYIVSKAILKINGAGRIFADEIHLVYLISAILTLSSYVALAQLKKYIEVKNESRFKYLEVALLIIASLLFSPITWKAHYANIIIPLAIAISFAANGNANRKVSYSALALFFIFSSVLGTDLTKFIPYVNAFNSMYIPLGTIVLAFAIIYAYKGYE